MSASARELLQQNLSPKAHQRVRSYWWTFRHFLPRFVTSPFVRRTAKVQGFPNGQASELVNRLRGINAYAPTHMCRVMTSHGSDKGHVRHNYTTVYSALFGRLRDRPLRILELGLGTNNPALVSSMGAAGTPGASLRGWRDLFPNALIYGADIDRAILFESDRIKTFYCDQLDSGAIHDLWSQPDLQGGMEIIIDDGLHTFEGNISFLEGSLEHLCPGGIYVVEDILSETIERWRNALETVYSKRFPNHEFAFVELPNAYNDYDNNMVIIRSPGGTDKW